MNDASAQPPLLNAVEFGQLLDEFLKWAVATTAARLSPLHGAVEMFVPPDGVDEVTVDVQGHSVKSPVLHLTTEFEVDPEAVRRTDLDEMVRLIELAARHRVEQTLGALDQYMSEATAAVGNNVTARKEDITWDWVLDQFQRVEWAEGADGLLRPPVPHGADTLPEMSESQQTRLDAMVQEKHDEHLARRRSRRLR